ncbi:unnamed protein product [Oppiella nova]|uniref:Serine-threonine/tyrosine-protein kinase catalytic domain-containing protein n=1 Tax=Oppiella nova TaxID=334625 RepID=A0A7R9QTF0_9ACAR|nr:unnamed protein product [Oppiella nova]CAG2173704.1 unnamed protein product [Oppiella nova]
MGNKLGLKSNFKNSQTQHTGALTFKKGENLEVSDLNDPDRWKVRRSETGMTFRDMREQVWTHKYRLLKPLWGECPDSYYNTMLKCWHEVPENRPTFEYLCHYFEDYFVDTERQYLKADDNE